MNSKSKQMEKELLERISKILDSAKVFMRNFKQKMNNGLYRYCLSSPRKYCLYATFEGICLENALGILDRDSIDYEKTLNFILDCQDAHDGYFRCPGCAEDNIDDRLRCSDDNRDGITFKTALTLALFGKSTRYPIPEGEKFTGNIQVALEKTFIENNPYTAGSIVWKKTGLYALKLLLEGNDPVNNHYVIEIINTLLGTQDPETGLWFHGGDLLNGMNGLLKMRYGTFDPVGMEVPLPDKIVETILSIQKTDGSFGSGCTDWNAVGLLAELARHSTKHRQNVMNCFDKVERIMEKKQDRATGGFRWGFDESEEVSLKATFINLMGILSMKAFMEQDEATVDEIFSLRKLRNSLIVV